MTISQILETLNARLLTPEADCSREVHTACGSDMMSDVLAYVKDQAVLLTGLNNPQVVRTADMMDMVCIVFVRGKKPDDLLLSLAQQRGICLLYTSRGGPGPFSGRSRSWSVRRTSAGAICSWTDWESYPDNTSRRT